MKAYSIDFRKRVLAMCDRGRTTREVARAFDVSESWVRRIKQVRREQGLLGPLPVGGRRHGHFDAARLSQLEGWLRQHPDATLEWLRAAWSARWKCVAVSWGFSGGEEAGLVAEKKTLRAAEQDRPEVARRRMNFRIARRFADIHQLVFLDESSAKTNMTRRYGRAPVGERCYFAAPQGHWHTTTLLSAIRSTGVVKRQPSCSMAHRCERLSRLRRTMPDSCIAYRGHRRDGQPGQPQGCRNRRGDRKGRRKHLVPAALLARSQPHREIVE